MHDRVQRMLLTVAVLFSFLVGAYTYRVEKNLTEYRREHEREATDYKTKAAADRKAMHEELTALKERMGRLEKKP